MSNPYLFGTYVSYNLNVDKKFTSDRSKAKWRSQIPIHATAEPVANSGQFYLLNDSVHLVAISDLDYQLKSVKPIDNRYWLKRPQGTFDSSEEYLGKEPRLVFTHFPVAFTPAANPNPNPFPKPAPFPKPLIGLEYLKFAETRLELGYDYGAVGGQSFETAITEVADDREQRNINRYLPLGRWQLGDRLYADSESDSLEEVKYLREFHNARKGSFEGFRFKDWADYKGTGEVIAVGDGVKTDFQLRKAYRAGSATTYRPIQKPVIGTVDILVNGVNVIYTPDHGWDVDHATGVVRNNTPLPIGATLSCNFEFDVPVWFETDEIGFKLEGYDPDIEASIYRLESVFVVEGRIPLTLPWVIPPLPEITEELDLGIVYDTIERYSHSTNKLELGSGYTRREAKREDSRILFDLGGRNYDRAEVDKILGYFYCARGKAVEFPFSNLGKSYKVRFDTDNLNLKFEAANTDDALFNLSGLKIQAVPDKGFGILDFIDKETTVYIFIDTSGSMNSSIPTINVALQSLKQTLAERVYGSVELMNQKVIQLNFGDERWLRLMTTYYQPKAIYLIWINEAEPTYHSGGSFSPTSSFVADLNDFLGNYSSRIKIKIILYSIIFNDSAFNVFQNHLLAALNGTSGYTTALKDYNFQLRLDVPENTTAEQYYQDFIGQQLLGDGI